MSMPLYPTPRPKEPERPMPELDPERLARLSAAVERRLAAAEPAHDYLHVLRVVASARTIAAAEGADASVVVPAALLHELFNHPKSHPESHLSGDVCAEHAAALLAEHGFAPAAIEPVGYAIR